MRPLFYGHQLLVIKCIANKILEDFPVSKASYSRYKEVIKVNCMTKKSQK